MAILPAAVPGTDGLGSLESLSGRFKRGDKNALGEMSREFESVMLGQVLKQMRQTLEPGTMFAGDTSDVFGGLFDQYIGRHLAMSGGLGLASALQRQLESRTAGHADMKGKAISTFVPAYRSTEVSSGSIAGERGVLTP